MSNQDPYQQYPAGGWQPTPNPSGPAVPDPYAQPAYGQPPYGQPAHGQPTYGQPPYAQPAYGQPVPAYGTPATSAPAFGPPAYGAPAYGAAPYGDVPYGAPVYANPGYGFPRFGGGFTYASWIARVGAYFLDSLASLPYLVGLIYMASTSVPGVDRFGNPTDQPTSMGALTFGVGALVTLVVWGWNRWVLAGRTGQSWGKKVVGLTLQRDVTGEPIGVGMAFLRDLAHYVDGILYIGYLLPLWDGKRQTLSDKIVKSVVVR
ncbi:RDD family protein [Cellulomonas humilata]|uniref:RDD domain-containing protein n=1 Tax=Cellulomonas humilata TaxID=144055 RepID=A0ABU0EAZ3_9CELL|nr:RDD family protein [Cellulomonas humilata]MDQ0372440.1 hypothetical protein [Cellulomonas humilata]